VSLTPPPCFACCACCQVIAATNEAQYLLTKPAAAYKKVYEPLSEKAAIAFEVGGSLACWLPCTCVHASRAAWLLVSIWHSQH